MLGTGITMLPNEAPLDAFLRFCVKEDLRFVDIVDAPEEIKKFEHPLPSKSECNSDFGEINTELKIC